MDRILDGEFPDPTEYHNQYETCSSNAASSSAAAAGGGGGGGVAAAAAAVAGGDGGGAFYETEQARISLKLDAFKFMDFNYLLCHFCSNFFAI